MSKEICPTEIQQEVELLQATRKGGPLRAITLELKELLSKPSLTAGAESVIASRMSGAIAYLSEGKEIYEYGRIDLIQGLAQVAHPETQAVIIDCLLDVSPNVVRTAEKALLDPNFYIHPETIETLIGDESESIKKKIGMAILENHPMGGLMPDKKVIPSLISTLERMLIEPEDEGVARKAAILSATLYERSDRSLPDTLINKARQFLAIYVKENVVKPLSTKEVFSKLVSDMVYSHTNIAKSGTNLDELEINLPSQFQALPEELGALILLIHNTQGHEDWELVETQLQLLALAKEMVREQLKKVASDARVVEEQKRKAFEAEVEQRKEQEKLKAQEEQERDRAVRKIVLEEALEAIEKFPHLSQLNLS